MLDARALLISFALVVSAATLAYLGCRAPEPAPELREAWFCGDGCDFDISREFPCACPTADDEVNP